MGCERRSDRRSHDHGAVYERNSQLSATVYGSELCGEFMSSMRNFVVVFGDDPMMVGII